MADQVTESGGAHTNDTTDQAGMSSPCVTCNEKSHILEEDTIRQCCEGGFKTWFLKYFWEGQILNETQSAAIEKVDPSMPLYRRILVLHRRPLAIIIPAIFFHLFWWAYMIYFNAFDYFESRYYMTITMIFGSVIAGMTSEGGGAVAFPVMTLVLHILPEVARDFSMMIQSCGMSAAAFTIFFMRVQLEWHAIVLCTLGGAVGMVFGLHVVDPRLTAAQKKIGFVSIWFAFASVLFLLNFYRKRRTFLTIPEFRAWKAGVLVLAGICGGVFTAFSGSGLDICTFAILTLLFRVSEKTATPTSVVLMAGNSIIGFYWRGVMMRAITDETWQYFAVCVPVVVIGAPLGSYLGSHFHRLVLATLVCLLELAALLGAYALVDLTKGLVIASFLIIGLGMGLFVLIALAGQAVLREIVNRETEQGNKKGSTDINDKRFVMDAKIAGVDNKAHSYLALN